MGFDCKEFEVYTKNFAKMARSFPQFMEQFMMKTSLQTLRSIKLVTPVDTGAMRDHWEASKVYRLANGNIGFFIKNTMEYASFVNDGHTTRNRNEWVEGYYMVEVTVAEIERKMPKRFENEFKKYMERLELI